jgi:hypothetical protein
MTNIEIGKARSLKFGEGVATKVTGKTGHGAIDRSR